MRIAVYSSNIKSNQLNLIKTVLKSLLKISENIYFFEIFKKNIKFINDLKINNFTFFNSNKDLIDNKIDLLISLGGDGTLLGAINYIQDSNIPIMGINLGRLGFLSNFQDDNLNETIDKIHKKDFFIEERTLLKFETSESAFYPCNFALNDITVQKNDYSSMINIHTCLNGEFLNSYWSDGLIISTATGSTGYSLSCGGPIMLPDSECFIITPISPHNLNVRPLIIPDTSVLDLIVESRNDEFIATLDSRMQRMKSGSKIQISKESFKINFIRTQETNFINTIRNKLSWGIDKRNFNKLND